MTEKAQEHKGGVLHQGNRPIGVLHLIPTFITEQQIKWHHLDPTKFLVYNVALHAVSDLLLYPPDTVRTRLQVQDAVTISNSQIIPMNFFEKKKKKLKAKKF